MPKLVVTTEGLSGRSHELTTERTTVGRLDDNTFAIPEPSVSSHHCEILLAGTEVRVKDLNSTNGTFINGMQISEAVLKPGQILRLGKVELKLEGEVPASAAKRPTDATLVMPKGVSLNELEAGPKTASFETAGKGFAKKDNRANKLFVVGAAAAMLIILGLLGWMIYELTKGG